MRHHNPISVSMYQRYRNRKVTSPYSDYGTFTRPNTKRLYIRAIQYVADHPGCKRFDILLAVSEMACRYADRIGYGNAKYSLRGQYSHLFSNLLYRDFLDYDNKFEYYITPDGEALLKEAYLADATKLVMKAS